jgi:hypothetical protein
MSNTSNADWDEASPAITDPRRQGAQEIRVLRGGVADRFLKEHVVPAAAGLGGEHLEGSARSYRSSGAPTTKPDGITLLDTNDEGRLWVDSDTNQIYSWTGSAWVLIGDLPITVVDYARWAKNSTTTAAGGSIYRSISTGATQSYASNGGWDTTIATGIRLTTGTYRFDVEFYVGSASTSELIGSKVTFSGTAAPSSLLHMLDGTTLPIDRMYRIHGTVVITAASSDFEFLVKGDANGTHVLQILAARFHFEKTA